MVSRRGGVEPRPMKIKSALPDSKGRAEPCPYKRQLFCMAVSSKSHTDKSTFTNSNN